MGGALGAVYDGGGRRQEALGQAGRSLSKRVLPPAVGMEADGLSFFYAGREHAAIAPMREKYTAMYPATAPNGAVGIRCPRCQNRIGQLIYPGWRKSVQRVAQGAILPLLRSRA